MAEYDDSEEMRSLEVGEWVPVSNFKEIKEQLEKAAAETALKDYRLNIRMASRDVVALKTRALEEGIPYQTLTAGVLHKYVTGRLVERMPG